ncbi:hypothetical protein [Almyronema epifaneia]|uniref:Low temperature-induced protein n=1 Tax=Almyronema epifaneia S1 TaxID=2991925 RepID=A0ABW6IGN0_9CYAN
MKMSLNATSIRRVVASVLAFCLCASLVFGFSGVAQARGSDDYQKNDRGQLQNYEPYDTVQSKADGMNQYDDTDPRRDTSAAQVKANELERKARFQQGAPNPLESAGDSLKNLGQQVKDNVEEVVK